MAEGTTDTRSLGDPRSAEMLLRELYVELRAKLRVWSAITRQTPQARMGYVGQHLVSVVTGFPGGRSGARGHDLVLPDKKYAEIKTCYRIDQLGQCLKCGVGVSSIENVCPECGAMRIARKEDSKWLITTRNDEEMRLLFDPEHYYLVLFDFAVVDEIQAREGADSPEGPVTVITETPPDVNARIWRVNPRAPGFALCMVDYYMNIRSKSRSKAPFNLWPFQLKFQLMRPELIYHATITANDDVTTTLFEGPLGKASAYPLGSLTALNGSYKNLSNLRLVELARRMNAAELRGSRKDMLLALEEHRRAAEISDATLCATIAEVLYREGVSKGAKWLPESLRLSP